jgi:hypothetical protein
MEIVITKSDFEQALPVGTSAHDEVFESIEPSLDLQKELIRMNLLGTAGEKMIEDDSKSYLLDTFVKKYVCVSSFLSVFRQLDLVLTPTGFGIVSTQEVSPASKQRVDALEGELRTQKLKIYATLIGLLRSEEWGRSSCAINAIGHVYNEFYFFGNRSYTSLTYQDWNEMIPYIYDADEYLRTRLSDEQMDEVVSAFRKGKETPYANLINGIIHFTDVFSKNGPDVARMLPLRKILSIVDADLNTYKLYAESTAYQANHHENFKNTKESSAFLFNG